MPSYIAIIHKEPESDYGVSFPDFPGCITAGGTLDEAKDMAVEALTGHIRCLLEDGEEIPPPSPLETILATPDFADGVAFLVSVSLPSSKTVRVNISVAADDLRQIDALAKKRGLSRSAFLIQAAKRELNPEEPGMAKIRLEYRQTESGHYRLTNEEFYKFGASLLDMVDFSRRPTTTKALVSIFDLAGFTSFCDQRDPERIVPGFLGKFLEWLFGKISDRLDNKIVNQEEKEFLAPLPDFAKFTGDGVLFLWELRDDLASLYVYEIIEALIQVCDHYQRFFLKQIADCIANPPAGLRCGITQGKVVSFGGGADYVGPCLNLASRLAKERKLSLVIAHQGTNLRKNMHRVNPEDFVQKYMKIDGIEKEEYVYLLKKEFDALPKKEKRKFKDIAP